MSYQVRQVLVIVSDPRPAKPLHQNSNTTVGHLEHPHNCGCRSVAVKVRARRLFFLEVTLGNEHDHSVLGERLFDGSDRTLALNEQRHDHVREDDDVSQRQDRQRVGQLHLLVRLLYLNFLGFY